MSNEILEHLFDKILENIMLKQETYMLSYESLKELILCDACGKNGE